MESNGVNINVRVFRRNLRNLIIVWNTAQLDPSLRQCTSAFILDGIPNGKETLLTFSKFVPDTPEKFPKDIDGIIVSHANNNMDPMKPYLVKVVFGFGECRHEEIKEVLAMSNFVIPEPPKITNDMHMYAYDYAERKWVPMPFDPKLVRGE